MATKILERITVYITPTQRERINKLPRTVNLSEKLRPIIDDILDELEK